MRCCSCFSKNQLESASLLLAVWLAPNTVVIPTYSRQVCHSSVCHPVFLNDSQNLSRLFHCLVINVRLFSFLATAIIEYHVCLTFSTTFLFYFFLHPTLFSMLFSLFPAVSLTIISSLRRNVNHYFHFFTFSYKIRKTSLEERCYNLH